MLNNKMATCRKPEVDHVNSKSGKRWQSIARRSMVAAVLLGGLVGCGGGDNENSGSGNTPQPSPIHAVDGFSLVNPGVATRVDLSAYVRGDGATLSSISSDNTGCHASKLDGLSAEVTSDSGLCIFAYKVTGQGGDASAVLNTFASTLESPVLPPLSQTMTIAEPNKVFDLEALYGSLWPDNYTLDENSLVVQGGSALGSATAAGNLLTYTPPSPPEPVWNRILFVLKDPSGNGGDAMGTLFITVSDSVNAPPVIGQPKYNYEAPVVTMQTVTLDLESLPGLNITSPDGDDWQLVEVQSYSASVAPLEPNSVINKKFTFTAGTVGEHIVSYIVGDHRAGFASGLIKIVVGASGQPKTWSDIIIGDVTYKATPLYSEVTSSGVIAEAVYDSGVSNTVAGVTDAAAKSYCSLSGGHVATKTELDTLFTSSAAAPERAKYPMVRTYVTYDDSGQVQTYNLQTGQVGGYGTVNPYVICVITPLKNVESLTVTPANSNLPMGLTQQFTAIARLTNGDEVDVTTNSAITWSSSNTAIASITAQGIATGESLGYVNISATGSFNNERFTSSVPLNVTDPVITGIEVNGHTFSPTEEFPRNGFSGAYFTVKLSLPSGDYDWDTNVTWASVDANGLVTFDNEPAVEDTSVIISATPKSGNESQKVLRYGFDVAHWFYPYGKTLYDHDGAYSLCQSNGYLSPSSSYVVFYGERHVGTLFEEWGDLTFYNSGFEKDKDYHLGGKDYSGLNGSAVNLGTGRDTMYPVETLLYAFCVRY